MNPRITTILALTVAATACGEPASDKGPEEQPLTDGKSDSFFNPTEHGPLRFDQRNPGDIAEDSRFHAWTFELSGEAAVDLRTEVSQNLDTVMYLYHREPGSDSWGRYLKKNDDHDGNIWSRIELSRAEAGEYRVIVKPYKKALRGGFSLVGTCDGAGCEAAQPSGECTAETFESLPQYTSYTPSCASDVLDVLNSEVEYASGGSVELTLKCDLDGVERQAIDFYHEWWDDIAGFDDVIAYGEEEVTLYFETRSHDQGTTVSVDAGGDEDGITFIFDDDGELLSLYQHNQSPTIDWFCGRADEAPIESPGEFCFSELMHSQAHGDEVGGSDGTTTVDGAADTHAALAAAAAQFAEDFGVDTADELTYQMLNWESLDLNEAAQVSLEHPDANATYQLFLDWDDTWKVRAREDADGTRILCD